MAAKILASLVDNVKKALGQQVDITSTTLWLDSATALLWIKKVGEWKPFVQHRVKEILKLTDRACWQHCPTDSNPADIGSRGTKATKLKDDKLWKEGPDWLVTEEWPKKLQNLDADEAEEERVKRVVQSNIVRQTESKQNLSSVIDCNRFSKEIKLYRVTARVLRFINNLKACVRKEDTVDGELSTEETRKAQKLWLEEIQRAFDEDPKFPKVRENLGVEKIGGLYRCQGRMQNADVPEYTRMPILLSREHYLTRLIILASHERVFHCRTEQTLAELRNKYWVCRGRSKVKQVVRDCERCKRQIAKQYKSAPPANLPEFRVKQSRPFASTGVDFAGPLFVKTSEGMKKSYVTLFTCAVTRAVHIELARDQSVPVFIQSLRKFAARRGMPERIVSDNAKTFQATSKWLRGLYQNQEVKRFLQLRNCVWQFNIPLAPWWGGFWERLVGSVKGCLKKVLGQAKLTFAELETLLIEIESTINCRPLTYGDDELGNKVLTPSHLLYVYRLSSMPDESIEETGDISDMTRRAKYVALKKCSICGIDGQPSTY
eukprot:Seg1067.16 transcript_id=Seg1067.16/GoldUCD/mRNA.D3Y31 product="putative protein K02A2.6" protein_id=Seg1067.16/GoldUCD/D3Y31